MDYRKPEKAWFNPANLTQADIDAFKERYQNDPVLFAREILTLDPDDNQVAALEAIRDYSYVAISSGRGIGKTWLDAIIALWVLCTRPGAKIMMLSNTDQQSRTMLWPPLIQILKASMVSEWFEHTTELVHFKGESEFAFIKRATWSENSIESVSGLHSPNMLYIVDEASRLPVSLLTSLYASCTQAWNKMIMTSNPTRTTGYYYDACQIGSGWHVIQVDSRSSKWTDKGKIKELIDRHGEDSDVVRVQVRGLFPMMSSMSVVSDGDIQRSMRATPRNNQDSDVVAIGIDIGGGGDPTCWCVRRGDKVLEIRKEITVEEGPIITVTQQLVQQYQAQWVGVDMTGLGHFLPGRFRQHLPSSVEVRGINFGESSPEADCFNMRSWLYRRVRDWIQQGGCIGNRPAIREQLLATEYVMDDKGRMKLIPKTAVAESIGHSPDESDSLAISCGYMGDLFGSLTAKRTSSNALAQMMMGASGWK